MTANVARGTNARQAGHMGTGNGAEVFLMEVDPSLVERKKKKKPLRRLKETVSGAWCRYHTTEIISVLKHQRALGCQALAS